MSKTIKYTSQNGYTGVLYGESSYAVYDKDGNECMHTGFRNINTYEELVEDVEQFPRFIEVLHGEFHRIYTESEEADQD